MALICLLVYSNFANIFKALYVLIPSIFISCYCFPHLTMSPSDISLITVSWRNQYFSGLVPSHLAPSVWHIFVYPCVHPLDHNLHMKRVHWSTLRELCIDFCAVSVFMKCDDFIDSSFSLHCNECVSFLWCNSVIRSNCSQEHYLTISLHAVTIVYHCWIWFNFVLSLEINSQGERR